MFEKKKTSSLDHFLKFMVRNAQAAASLRSVSLETSNPGFSSVTKEMDLLHPLIYFFFFLTEKSITFCKNGDIIDI